jgi:hypothetical protein
MKNPCLLESLKKTEHNSNLARFAQGALPALRQARARRSHPLTRPFVIPPVSRRRKPTPT